MHKYIWISIGIAGVIVLVVAGIYYIPILFNKPLGQGPDMVTVTPGHWWKVELNEEQLAVFEKYWGDKEITVKEIIEQICPDVLNELPPDAIDAYSTLRVYWPMDTFNNWINEVDASMLFSRIQQQEDGSLVVYGIFTDRKEYEFHSFTYNDLGKPYNNEKSCRISFYTDRVIQKVTPN